jgi:hypothetical protein
MSLVNLRTPLTKNATAKLIKLPQIDMIAQPQVFVLIWVKQFHRFYESADFVFKLPI